MKRSYGSAHPSVAASAYAQPAPPTSQPPLPPGAPPPPPPPSAQGATVTAQPQPQQAQQQQYAAYPQQFAGMQQPTAPAPHPLYPGYGYGGQVSQPPAQQQPQQPVYYQYPPQPGYPPQAYSAASQGYVQQPPPPPPYPGAQPIYYAQPVPPGQIGPHYPHLAPPPPPPQQQHHLNGPPQKRTRLGLDPYQQQQPQLPPALPPVGRPIQPPPPPPQQQMQPPARGRGGPGGMMRGGPGRGVPRGPSMDRGGRGGGRGGGSSGRGSPVPSQFGGPSRGGGGGRGGGPSANQIGRGGYPGAPGGAAAPVDAPRGPKFGPPSGPAGGVGRGGKRALPGGGPLQPVQQRKWGAPHGAAGGGNSSSSSSLGSSRHGGGQVSALSKAGTVGAPEAQAKRTLTDFRIACLQIPSLRVPAGAAQDGEEELETKGWEWRTVDHVMVGEEAAPPEVPAAAAVVEEPVSTDQGVAAQAATAEASARDGLAVPVVVASPPPRAASSSTEAAKKHRRSESPDPSPSRKQAGGEDGDEMLPKRPRRHSDPEGSRSPVILRQQEETEAEVAVEVEADGQATGQEDAVQVEESAAEPNGAAEVEEKTDEAAVTESAQPQPPTGPKGPLIVRPKHKAAPAPPASAELPAAPAPYNAGPETKPNRKSKASLEERENSRLRIYFSAPSTGVAWTVPPPTGPAASLVNGGGGKGKKRERESTPGLSSPAGSQRGHRKAKESKKDAEEEEEEPEGTVAGEEDEDVDVDGAPIEDEPDTSQEMTFADTEVLEAAFVKEADGSSVPDPEHAPEDQPDDLMETSFELQAPVEEAVEQASVKEEEEVAAADSAAAAPAPDAAELDAAVASPTISRGSAAPGEADVDGADVKKEDEDTDVTDVDEVADELLRPAAVAPPAQVRASLEPTQDRISISYCRNSRRLIIDADVIEKVRILRKKECIEVDVTIEPPSQADGVDKYRPCKGIIIEAFDKLRDEYIVMSQQELIDAWEPFDDSAGEEAVDKRDELLPPLHQLYVDPSALLGGSPEVKTKHVTFTVHLDRLNPLTEAKWVKTGDIETWFTAQLPGSSVERKYPDSWKGKIVVVDPDPPQTIHHTMKDWAANSQVGSPEERRSFVAGHMSNMDNVLEILLRLTRGEGVGNGPSSSSSSSRPISQSTSVGQLAASLSAPYAEHQTQVSLAVLAMFRLSMETSAKAGIKKEEMEEQIAEIIRTLPPHMIFRALDGMFRSRR